MGTLCIEDLCSCLYHVMLDIYNHRMKKKIKVAPWKKMAVGCSVIDYFMVSESCELDCLI
jgi:hypothetical protein